MIYDNLLEPNKLVFDVGMNLGDKSEVYLKKGCRVVGFEPLLECYEHAMKRFVGYSNFNAENIALDKKEGLEKIYLANYHTISSMSTDFIKEAKKERFREYDWSNERVIRTNTLDNMIIKYGKPDYIKIDVEGYEYNVVSGLSTTIDLISIEFNPELCDHTIRCIDYIDQLNGGNTIFNYTYRFDESFKFQKWFNKNEIFEYLKSINDFSFEFGDVYCKQSQ